MYEGHASFAYMMERANFICAHCLDIKLILIVTDKNLHSTPDDKSLLAMQQNLDGR